MGVNLIEHHKSNFATYSNDIDENAFPQKREQKVSVLFEKVENQNKRKQQLAEIREIVEHISKEENELNGELVQMILNDKRFSELFFNLFDENCSGALKQSSWCEKLKAWTEVI